MNSDESTNLRTRALIQEANADVHTIAAIGLRNRPSTVSASSATSIIDVYAGGTNHTDVDPAAAIESN